jgi:hypothetical protein
MASHEPRLQTTEKPVPLTGISKAIKRFNRNTTWVATGLLAPVIFAAVMVALQERHAKAYNLTEEAGQARVDPLVKANPAAISDIGGSNKKRTAEIASGQATNVDLGLIPNQPNVLGNVTPSSPPERTDSARVIHTKTPSGRYRSSIRRSIVDVRSRLIALWHQSLREKSRGWTPFSNSDKWQRENISYASTTSH